MRWLEIERKESLPAAAGLELLRKAAAVRPDNVRLVASLAKAHMRAGEFQQAILALEGLIARDLCEPSTWARVAQCRLKLGRYEAALEACRHGDAHAPSAPIAFYRGQIFSEMKRFDDARVAFLSVLALGDRHLSALKALLAPLAADLDGSRLLEFCETLQPRYSGTALVRAHRAIAFSRLGRNTDALELVNLDHHVSRMALEPPAEFGNVERFNRTLAEEVIAASGSGEEFEIYYSPRTKGRPAMSALLSLIRGAMTAYIGEMGMRGLDAVMPPPPEAATLFGAEVILKGGGTNGEHIHPTGYISSVYHVQIPRSVREAEDHRGALVLGKCEDYTGGYRPCWGIRHLQPMAGWLTLFPSHIYHDIVPSRTDELRISVASDLTPVTE